MEFNDNENLKTKSGNLKFLKPLLVPVCLTPFCCSMLYISLSFYICIFKKCYIQLWMLNKLYYTIEWMHHLKQEIRKIYIKYIFLKILYIETKSKNLLHVLFFWHFIIALLHINIGNVCNLLK